MQTTDSLQLSLSFTNKLTAHILIYFASGKWRLSQL